MEHESLAFEGSCGLLIASKIVAWETQQRLHKNTHRARNSRAHCGVTDAWNEHRDPEPDRTVQYTSPLHPHSRDEMPVSVTERTTEIKIQRTQVSGDEAVVYLLIECCCTAVQKLLSKAFTPTAYGQNVRQTPLLRLTELS